MKTVIIRVTHTVDVEVEAEYGDTHEMLIAKATPDLPVKEMGLHAMVLQDHTDTLPLDHPDAAKVLGYDPMSGEAVLQTEVQ